MISRHLFVLLACVFIVMISLGITMPVLPFYVERLALAEGVSRQSVVIHVGLLTGVYALGQLIFAPVWGRLSDRTGRRPLILIGIAGYVVAWRPECSQQSRSGERTAGGGALFIWQMNAPYLLTGALLVTVALIIGWKATDRRCEARLA